MLNNCFEIKQLSEKKKAKKKRRNIPKRTPHARHREEYARTIRTTAEEATREGCAEDLPAGSAA